MTEIFLNEGFLPIESENYSNFPEVRNSGKTILVWNWVHTEWKWHQETFNWNYACRFTDSRYSSLKFFHSVVCFTQFWDGTSNGIVSVPCMNCLMRIVKGGIFVLGFVFLKCKIHFFNPVILTCWSQESCLKYLTIPK